MDIRKQGEVLLPYTEKKTVISALKRSIPAVALILALAPSAARAGAIQALHFALKNSLDTAAAEPHIPAKTPDKPKTDPKSAAKPDLKDPAKNPEKPVTIGLNDKGDMAIKRGDLSVIMSYNAPEDMMEPKERMQVAQTLKQEPPSINGISLKLSFVF
jgi:hypothetical protein